MQKFLLMEGAGANGKSVTVDILTGMLGTANVSSVPLAVFDARFALIPTHGKLLNVCNEVTTLKPRVEGIVKQYVGGDLITVDRKNLSPIQFRPTARILVTTNERPRVSDRSEGFWRRMLVLPFRVTIPESKQDNHLKTRLATELPGIFNWACIGLIRLLARDRFTESSVAKAAIEAFRAEDDPIREFALAYLAPQPDGVVPKGEAYEAYVRWCGKQGEVAVTNRDFGRAIRKAITGIRDGHTTRDRRNVEAYKGIALVASR